MAGSLRQAFEQTLADFRPSIILSSWIYPDTCAALRLLNGRVPLVAIAQGSDLHQYLAMPARRRIILHQLPHAAAVITRSRELARLLQTAGFPPEKLHTIYNGVSLDTFQPRDQSIARRQSSLPEDARIILFAGNFYKVKNPHFLITASTSLDMYSSTDGIPTLLVMAGGGPWERTCRDMVARFSKFRKPPRVIFAGRKTPEEIARLMNAADLLAIPSRNEGVPNVLLEAFASGLPVVASHVGGIPEVLDHDFLGSTFPPNDLQAFVTAVRHQFAAPRDTAAIRLHAERFTWSAAASQYREILTSAC
jgi:glycosyltransferase involved in cell wall biosynthesis